MIIYKKYIQKDGIGYDHVYYQSSNIEYSMCEDHPNNRLKTLTIVFGKGRTYRYDNVDVNDYVNFKNAILGENLLEKSNGKAFHRYIKNYPATKLDDTDLNKLQEQKIQFMKLDESEKIAKLTDEEKVNDCFNLMINGNITDIELVEKYGKEIFDKAIIKENEYLKTLND